MPDYNVSQLIEVNYTIVADDEDTAYNAARTMEWDISAWPHRDVEIDGDGVQAYFGGPFLSFSVT